MSMARFDPEAIRTLATILAAGSLGSTIALARDKTFQALAMTALWISVEPSATT